MYNFFILVVFSTLFTDVVVKKIGYMSISRHGFTYSSLPESNSLKVSLGGKITQHRDSVMGLGRSIIFGSVNAVYRVGTRSHEGTEL